MRVAGHTVTKYGIALLAIVSLGLLLRVYNLGAASVYMDEAFTVAIAKLSVPNLIAADTGDTNPPLYYLLLHYWIDLFGTSESAVRLLPALFGTLAIPVAYLVGRQLFDREAGIWGALLLAVSSFNIYYAQETRMYSLMVLLALVSMYFFLRLVQQASTAVSVGYVLSTALLLYTHVYGLLILVIQNVYVLTLLLLAEHRPLQLRRWLPLQAIVVALFIPWMVVYITHPSIVGLVSWLPQPTADTIIDTFYLYSGYAHQSILLALLLGLSIFSLFTYRRVRDSAVGRRVSLRALENSLWEVRVRGIGSAYFLAVWVLTTIIIPFALSLVWTPIYYARYTIVASVALYLLAAKGIKNVRNRYAKTAVVGVILVLCSTSVLTYYGDWIITERAQAREAINVINENAKSGDVVASASRLWPYTWAYYNKTSASVAETQIFNPYLDTGSVNELQAAVNGHARVWLISERPSSEEPSNKETLALTTLNESYKTTDFGHYYWYRVYLLEKRA